MPIYGHNNFYQYDNTATRMAYAAVGKTKEDDWSRFQLSSATTSFTSVHPQANALERFCSDAAQIVSPRHELISRSHACRTQEGYDERPSVHREDSQNSELINS